MLNYCLHHFRHRTHLFATQADSYKCVTVLVVTKKKPEYIYIINAPYLTAPLINLSVFLFMILDTTSRGERKNAKCINDKHDVRISRYDKSPAKHLASSYRRKSEKKKEEENK